MRVSLPGAVLSALLLNLVAVSPVWAEGGFLSLELGKGTIDVDRPSELPFTPTGSSEADTPAFSIGGGYYFPSGLYLDIAFTELDTVTLFLIPDAFELTAVKLGVGYAIPASSSLNFLVKTGVAFWKFDTSESPLFNPGPEASKKFTGTDLFFEFGGEYKIGQRFRISLTHTRDQFDIGDASATRLGIKFFFGDR